MKDAAGPWASQDVATVDPWRCVVTRIFAWGQWSRPDWVGEQRPAATRRERAGRLDAHAEPRRDRWYEFSATIFCAQQADSNAVQHWLKSGGDTLAVVRRRGYRPFWGLAAVSYNAHITGFTTDRVFILSLRVRADRACFLLADTLSVEQERVALGFEVDAFTDPGGWNIYADWLEERDDARAPLVRRLALSVARCHT